MKPTKCAFVTGGSRGIGSGVVKVLAREGYDIAFTYHSAEEEAKEMSEYVKGLGRRCFYYQASLEERDVPTRVTRQAIQDLGRLDVLVNNAGVTRHNLVTEMDADFIDFVYGVDFRNYIPVSYTHLDVYKRQVFGTSPPRIPTPSVPLSSE